MIRITTLALICLLPLLTAACNTVDGAGQDIKEGGHAISRAAEDAQN